MGFGLKLLNIRKLSNLVLCLIFTFSFVLFSIASVSAASSYTSSTANAVTVAINPIINISDGNSGTTTLGNITPTGAGRMSTKTDALSVTTNDVGGYTVTINMSGATQTLVSGANTIAKAAGTTTATVATPAALVVGSGTATPTGAWGFCVPNSSGNGSYTIPGFGTCTDGTSSSVAMTSGLYAAVPQAGTPFTLFTTNASSVGTYTTTVTFGVAVNNGQASGTYTGTVVFTAIAT